MWHLVTTSDDLGTTKDRRKGAAVNTILRPLQALRVYSLFCIKVCFFLKLFWTETRLSQLDTQATIWLIVPAPDDDDECGTVGGMIGKVKPKYSEKACQSTALSTTNRT
jgi:hypothetical protein